ncbi:phosphoribosylanthranilate isomerase [Echinicola sp. 20G]|uniref:phosphoribosylanthranilate isomerase n=1 Tax=Echinicola sp. 20G TaxID=2781961 RepID=UPI001910A921|nr:phosphoribosylanthranilate isomerase [Echinicola sp. 20G]
MLIKVCGMRDPENVKELVEEVNPDLMGMIFYPKSSRYVKEESQMISPSKVKKVGVFVNDTIEKILEMETTHGLSYIQLHGDEDFGFVKTLSERSKAGIIKVFRVEADIDWEVLQPYQSYVKYFLFDTQTKKFGGSGKKFDWSVLEEYPLDKPFLLSGGIDDKSSTSILELQKKVAKMAGVDINSKFEIEPALKDIMKIKTFVTELRSGH